MTVAGAPSSGTVTLLRDFHERLDIHFRALLVQRQQLEPAGPVFTLEHGLETAELELLKGAVRAAVANGLGPTYRPWWLPFVVYAADVGYDYVGKDFWPPFAERTPGWEAPNSGWDVSGHRTRVRNWFLKFADEYGGARPTGAFAEFFINIAWPIMHAVLPIYLQRQLAQLLDEYSVRLTSEVLNDPDALGEALAREAYRRDYPERFQKFCSQHALLGRISAALLAGDDEETPYLLRSTLQRIVDGLTSEQTARLALSRARHSASRVRSTGFRGTPSSAGASHPGGGAPTLTDPRLHLKHLDDGWRLFADIPDLNSLGTRLPEVTDELRVRRGRIAGVERPVAPGRLLRPGEQHLGSLPTPGTPFVTLLDAAPAVNTLISMTCHLSPGPWWVFKRRTDTHAIEIKGKHVTPNRQYLLLGHESLAPPDLPWLDQLDAQITGARAFALNLPSQITDNEAQALTVVGISVISDVRIRPVGLVPLMWDGEGAVDYLAGDSVAIAISSQHAPKSCVLMLDGGAPRLLDWPAGNVELFFALDHLGVGVHLLSVSLLGNSTEVLAAGELMVTVRQPSTESPAPGEGIRLTAAPARPLLTDLWDGLAVLTIDGPADTDAQMTITLRDDRGTDLATLRRTVSLPLTEPDWLRIVRDDLRGHDLGEGYDAAETCEVVVSRSGVGYSTLTCERGFRPLRWVIGKQRDGRYEAHLIDRTDGAATRVELFEATAPLEPVFQLSGIAIENPTVGGLLRATSGNLTASVILPPDHMELLRLHNRARPNVRVGNKSLTEAMRLIRGHHTWATADLPANPFADRQRQKALESITSELVGLLAGNGWVHQERRQREDDILDHLEAMQGLVGNADERQLAGKINEHLWRWASEPELRLPELSNLLSPLIASTGMGDPRAATRFLMCLASDPGKLLLWNEADRNRLLDRTLRSSVALRLVRLAVLGSDALRPETIQKLEA